MAHTVQAYEVCDEEEMAIAEVTQPYRALVRETPALQSILYDIDLLPEQIRMHVNAGRMAAFCELFKRLTPEQVASLFQTKSAEG